MVANTSAHTVRPRPARPTPRSSRRRPEIALIAVLFLTVAGGACGNEPWPVETVQNLECSAVDPSVQPRLHISHSRLVFETPPLGEKTSSRMTLRNTGRGPLIVFALDLTDNDDSAFSIAQGAVQEPMELAPGETHTVSIFHKSTGIVRPTATVQIVHNDQSRGCGT